MNILDFYKRTSLYTDLGLYKDFAKNLPDDVSELSLLQRRQIIHPVIILNNLQEGWWDDLSLVPEESMVFEDDVLPTAQTMLAELLRRDKVYGLNRKVEDKIHVVCRGEALLLCSILKAKGIPCRVRSGFSEYLRHDGVYYDHWIVEYYNKDEDRWILVDADGQCGDSRINFDLNDIPRNEFLMAADAYLKLRDGTLKNDNILFASDPITLGFGAAIRGLFFDFHCLMNDEVILLHVPQYIIDKNFELSDDEFKELDELATLMKNPNDNFDKLFDLWNSKLKFRKMVGGLN